MSKEASRQAQLSLAAFVNAPSNAGLKGLMLSAISVLQNDGPESPASHQCCNQINWTLRHANLGSPLKGIIQRRIGPLGEAGNSVDSLKGAYQAILDDLTSKGHEGIDGENCVLSGIFLWGGHFLYCGVGCSLIFVA